MRIALGCLGFALLATSAAAQTDRPWYTPGARAVRLNELSKQISDTMGIALNLSMPPAADAPGRFERVGKVFAALASVYTELKIPADIRDSSKLMIGNAKFYRRSDLGGKSLATYLECGQDINGIFAEIYRISMSMVTFLTPGENDEISLRTIIFATAVDIPRPPPNTAECGSTGELERRIYQMTLKALGKGFSKAP